MKRIIPALILSFFLSACAWKQDVYNVVKFGADPNGRVLSTYAIQRAIDKCFEEGGGTVSVPRGRYLVGTINLKSGIEFRLEKQAVLVATTDLSQYQKHNDGLAGVLYTEDAENVALSGEGCIFGQGMEFMYADSAKVIAGPVLQHTRQKESFRKVESGIGDGPLHPKDRFNQMIIFSNCRNVRIEGIKCVDSPYWCFLIVHCEKVLVHGISIDNNLLIPNSDGLDIISSSDVIVSDCDISCGDDAIVLAGYAWHFGDPGFKKILKPVRNINVTNCNLRSRSSAIRIGGWDQNPMSDFNLSNINIYDSNCGIGICIRDGAGLSDVNFTNFNIRTRLHTGDWWGNGEPVKLSVIRDRESVPGAVRDINFTNFNTHGENSVLFYASEESTVEGIRLANFTATLQQSELEEVAGGNYDLRPSSVADREIYAAGIPVIYFENIKSISLSDVSTSLEPGVTKSYISNGIKTKGSTFAKR